MDYLIGRRYKRAISLPLRRALRILYAKSQTLTFAFFSSCLVSSRCLKREARLTYSLPLSVALLSISVCNAGYAFRVRSSSAPPSLLPPSSPVRSAASHGADLTGTADPPRLDTVKTCCHRILFVGTLSLPFALLLARVGRSTDTVEAPQLQHGTRPPSKTLGVSKDDDC